VGRGSWGGEEDAGRRVAAEPGVGDETSVQAGQGEGEAEGGSGELSRAADEEAQREGVKSLASHPEALGSGATGPEASGSGQSRGAEQIESLTPREEEVLKLLSQGQTNPQIAQNLLFSVSAVQAQVRSILTKPGVSDRTQAAVRAIKSRLTISGID